MATMAAGVTTSAGPFATAPTFSTRKLVRSSVCCAVRSQDRKSAASSCAEKIEPAEKAAAPFFKLSGAVVPILAAALVGSVQPAVQASEGDKLLVPVQDTETVSGDNAYSDLLQRIRERKAREKANQVAPPTAEKPSASAASPIMRPPPTVEKPSAAAASPFVRPLPVPEKEKVQTAPAEEEEEEDNSDSGSSLFSFPYFSPPPIFSTPPPPPVSAPQTRTPEAPKPAPVEIKQKEREVVQKVEADAATNQKTHGFMPLFISQLLLLVAFVGGGYVVVTTPDSKWKEVQKIFDDSVEKATPVVRDTWKKVKPAATQAQQKVKDFAEIAKPFVGKAWEASKPLAAKAVEASKPVLKNAQVKASEMLREAQEKIKS